MKYDLLLDKGTFDAISLMEDFGSAVRERYLKATQNLLKKDGLFLIASCNWTIDEIGQHMATCTELIFEHSIVSVLYLADEFIAFFQIFAASKFYRHLHSSLVASRGTKSASSSSEKNNTKYRKYYLLFLVFSLKSFQNCHHKKFYHGKRSYVISNYYPAL